jgi:hypothetical protein
MAVEGNVGTKAPTHPWQKIAEKRIIAEG